MQGYLDRLPFPSSLMHGLLLNRKGAVGGITGLARECASWIAAGGIQWHGKHLGAYTRDSGTYDSARLPDAGLPFLQQQIGTAIAEIDMHGVKSKQHDRRQWLSKSQWMATGE